MEQLILRRLVGKKVSDEKIEAQIEYIIGRGLKGARGNGWRVERIRHPARRREDKWEFRYDLTFDKVNGRGKGTDTEYRQWEAIKAMIIQSGNNTKFGEYPWTVLAPNGIPIVQVMQNQLEQRVNGVVTTDRAVVPQDNAASFTDKGLGGVREIQTTLTAAKTWSDLVVPPELLSLQSDEYLVQHPAWRDLYGVGPQIRTVLSNIKRAHDTEGGSRNHGVLYGHAGCGKTTTLLAIEQMFGSGAVLRLDATSTTRAGIEKLFFSDLQQIPPLVFMEEAEKADPEALKVWLGALDDRGEIRKVNFRVNQLREVRVLFICTVNNKTLFDKMMGSDGSEAGALSSRCVSQIYFPRPSEMVLQQILQKEIAKNGGDPRWIPPCLTLAKEMGISDPRTVRSYLAGGDRLMDGSYQADWKAISMAASTFRK
jgi:hypothetical protein